MNGITSVYGKKINDLLTVDYDALSMLNISATQELYRIIKAQQETIKAQQATIKVQQGKTDAMGSDIDKLKASIETLQQIVGSKAQK